MRYAEIIVFVLLLIDSIIANIVSWGGESAWYAKHFRTFSRWFLITKGWTTYYLILVLWMGVIIFVGQ